jgi:hypothetical protein
VDLGEPKLSEPVILQFCGMLCDLAKQKFSSNVIEKCIRVAEPPTKKILVEEMISSGRIEDMLRDCYANYVIQTSVSSNLIPISDTSSSLIHIVYLD